MPKMFSNLALSLGDTVVHASSTPRGAQFIQHVSNSARLNGIRQGNWDVCFLQEQSQKPSFPDAQVATDIYPYAAQLSDSFSGIELYKADESHPSAVGSYLIACTFYASFFRKNVTGATYTGGLTAIDAQRIQQLVDVVVFDSLSTWYIDRYDVSANFTSTVNGGQVTFSNNSKKAQNYHWDFGGVILADTTENPSHTYNKAGSCIVTLIASDSCGHSDTSSQIVTIATIINTTKVASKSIAIKLHPNPSSGEFSIYCKTGIKELRIFIMLGQELLHLKDLGDQEQHIKLSGADFKGVHYLFIRDERGQERGEKLLVY